jgi:hypothetical protein
MRLRAILCWFFQHRWQYNDYGPGVEHTDPMMTCSRCGAFKQP